MVIQRINDHCLDEMFKVLEKFGKNWPPYPQNFRIPEEVRSSWDSMFYSGINRAFVLLKNCRFYEKFLPGETFNAVVLSKKRKRGIKYSERTHRIYQFYWHPGFFGKVVFDTPDSGNQILRQGELVNGLVYRFEITEIDKRKQVFYCAPLKGVFNRGNLLHNLLYCNYQARQSS